MAVALRMGAAAWRMHVLGTQVGLGESADMFKCCVRMCKIQSFLEFSCVLHGHCGHLLSRLPVPGLGPAEVDPTAIDLLDGTRAAAPRCHSSVAMFPLELAILAAQRWTGRRSALVTVVSPVGAVLSSGIRPEMLRFSGDVFGSISPMISR